MAPMTSMSRGRSPPMVSPSANAPTNPEKPETSTTKNMAAPAWMLPSQM